MKKLEIEKMQNVEGGADWFGFITGAGCIYSGVATCVFGYAGFWNAALVSGLAAVGFCAY